MMLCQKRKIGGGFFQHKPNEVAFDHGFVTRWIS